MPTYFVKIILFCLIMGILPTESYAQTQFDTYADESLWFSSSEAFESSYVRASGYFNPEAKAVFIMELDGYRENPFGSHSGLSYYSPLKRGRVSAGIQGSFGERLVLKGKLNLRHGIESVDKNLIKFNEISTIINMSGITSLDHFPLYARFYGEFETISRNQSLPLLAGSTNGQLFYEWSWDTFAFEGLLIDVSFYRECKEGCAHWLMAGSGVGARYKFDTIQVNAKVVQGTRHELLRDGEKREFPVARVLISAGGAF